MPRYFAFLRAINVGGRYVRMEQLRRAFESLDLANVETFISSGNVTFESPSSRAKNLATEIETAVHQAVGYNSAVFLRSASQVKSIARYEPFASGSPQPASGPIHVALLSATPTAIVRKTVLALSTDEDALHFHGRELYWRALAGLSQSRLSAAQLERALKAPVTLRNVNTFARLAAKYLN